ncbi:MAG: glycyl-radical enzyme activating protein [Bacteroidales bacterium]|nr:glycyl-radical enzyme activating protein [Bacteroidales bacterium]
MEHELKARIFDIQGLSVHDGPGCRTLVFMSGCTLRCFWCSNPEGIDLRSGLMHYDSLCILCGDCAQACLRNAITIADGQWLLAREICSDCMEQVCVEACNMDALRVSGYEMTLDETLKIIQRDRFFWGVGGGVTLTGGEPLLQIDFVSELLKESYERYIHTAIETCGNVPWENFERVLPFLEWIFYDIKNMDSQAHKKATGVANPLILENARKLSAVFPGRLIFRMPLIPGFNDGESNIHDTIGFLKRAGRSELNILPLHHLGKEKYKMLGREYKPDKLSIPSKEKLEQVKNTFTKAGINCYVGSDVPF